MAARIGIAVFSSNFLVIALHLDTGLFTILSDLKAQLLEGSGLTYLGADACRVRMSTYRDAGMLDFLRDSEDGVLVEAHDAKGIEVMLARHFAGRAKFGTDSIRLTSKAYRWPPIGERIAGFSLCQDKLH